MAAEIILRPLRRIQIRRHRASPLAQSQAARRARRVKRRPPWPPNSAGRCLSPLRHTKACTVTRSRIQAACRACFPLPITVFHILILLMLPLPLPPSTNLLATPYVEELFFIRASMTYLRSFLALRLRPVSSGVLLLQSRSPLQDRGMNKYRPQPNLYLRLPLLPP